MAERSVDFLVIGTGVNLMSGPSSAEYPATSLVGEGIATVPPARVLEAVGKALG